MKILLQADLMMMMMMMMVWRHVEVLVRMLRQVEVHLGVHRIWDAVHPQSHLVYKHLHEEVLRADNLLLPPQTCLAMVADTNSSVSRMMGGGRRRRKRERRRIGSAVVVLLRRRIAALVLGRHKL